MNDQTIKSYFIYYWDIIHLVVFFLTWNFDRIIVKYIIYFFIKDR